MAQEAILNFYKSPEENTGYDEAQLPKKKTQN